jgi:hypothetical protein
MIGILAGSLSLESLLAGYGVASTTIWSCYAKFKSLSLFISLEID